MIADDLKFGWRQLVKSPGFSATAIVTLALAIGANTAVFSLVDAVLLKPLPYPDPERLGTMGAVYMRNGVEVDRGDMSLDGKGWEALKRVASIDAALYSGLSSRVSLVGPAGTTSVEPQRVSAGYFRVLGVSPALGREFTTEEDVAGGPALTILSDRVWRSVFAADPAVVGRNILLKGEPHTVVGVMPTGFKSRTRPTCGRRFDRQRQVKATAPTMAWSHASRMARRGRRLQEKRALPLTRRCSGARPTAASPSRTSLCRCSNRWPVMCDCRS